MKKLAFAVLIGFTIYIGCTSVQPIAQRLANIPEITDVSYNSHVKYIVEENCITCHSGKYPTADMSLVGYENVVAAVKSRGVLDRINNHEYPMPTGGLMSKNERLAIQKWADNDFALNSKIPVDSTFTSPAKFEYTPPSLSAVNIDEQGFEFMEKMQGHWIGNMFLLGEDIPWFTFDFRAINSSQLHGLFEGGSIGNLFNTFFVAEYKGVKTIMLRNGGILSGLYRTSYFVLTEVNDDTYLFEDAYGGKDIMWVRISFKKNKMSMLTYTSKFGSRRPTRHIEFEGYRHDDDLYTKAADRYQFPSKDVIVKSFPNGMPVPDWGPQYPTATSASYIMRVSEINDYVTLGKLAQDPIQINEVDNIASLRLKFTRSDLSKGKKVSVYLSRIPLTDNNGLMKTAYGYITESAMNEVILFPEINQDDHDFMLYYLHQGKCYLTCVVDNDNDYTPGSGDYYNESIELNLTSEETTTVEISSITKIIQ